jgi:fatty acid desaturase
MTSATTGRELRTRPDAGPPVRPGTIRPAASILHDVLPAGELNAKGRPTGALRDDLYRPHNVRNACNVVAVWVQSLGVIALALWIGNPIAWVVAFFLMGRAFALFAILGHESAHRLLFTNRKVNDFVGRWLLAYPGFVPLDGYRRSHMAHHKDEFGPNEPDMNLYRGYPIPRDSWHRKLRRDSLGKSGWKSLKGLLLAFRSSTARPVALRIAAWQVALFVGFTMAGYPLAYPLLWLLPWMTVWRVINRLRGVAEHGGMERSDDRRLTTHHIHQSWLARFWMVPYNTGWHLAHHVDIGVPFQNLPRFHRELVRVGWIDPALEYPSYWSFWRRASGRRADVDS